MSTNIELSSEIRNEINSAEIAKCEYEDYPKQIEALDSGLDKQYSFIISSKNFEMIDIVTETD
jgi:hypothetical protein